MPNNISLKSLELATTNKEFWARIRGDRLFLFYLPLKRIGIEVRTVADDAGNNLRKNFYMQFIDCRGKVLSKTIADLIEILEESSQQYQRKRSQYEQHHQRNTKQQRTNRCMPIRHKDGHNRIYTV